MRMRKEAPLLFALVALLSGVQAASASHCGAFRFSRCSNACSDAQTCYSTCQQQNRVCYKLVYDTVMEKRWHTCYKTVQETVNRQVSKTCYKDETRYRDCQVTKYKMVQEECTKPVTRTCWKDVQCHVLRPQIENCVKEVECCVRRCVPKHCEKEYHYTVCKPVYEQHCHVQCCQVQKQICEQHCHEVCQRVCRPVTECRHREVCCQVAKCLEECHVRQVCVPCCKDVTETCYKNVTKRICEPCTTYKTVTKRISECVDVPCGPIHTGLANGPFRSLFAGIGLGCGNGCGNTGCSSSASACNGGDCCDPCFDPCAGKIFHLRDRLRSGGGIGSRLDGCKGPCANGACGDNCGPTPTRKVWRVRCVTEQVPCTTFVTKCVTEQVAYTVCKKVHYNEVRNVQHTVRRNVRGAYVDDKGHGHECDGPGRHFKEGAVAKKLVPYTVTKMVTTLEKKMVCRTVSRCARGAYVDDKDPGQGKGDAHGDAKGKTYATDGPGRRFQEGATFNVSKIYTTCKMVQEHHVKKVPHTEYVNVIEKQIKTVPYQVCRMVPHTITKKVSYQECVQEKFTVCKKVPYTECVKQSYTCRVPYTVCETVPCTVTKRIKVCVPETVCVKKARLIPVTITSDPGSGCGNDCCDARPGFLSRLRQRGFASLCSTGCCEETCKTSCRIASSYKSTCNDYCREGLLQRLFRNRFACEPNCCDTGCSSTSASAMPPAWENIPLPKALPKN